MALSSRGEAALSTQASDFMMMRQQVAENAFHATDNPSGIVDLSIAENALSLPHIASKLASLPPPPPHALRYNKLHGTADTRKVLADFLAAYHVGGPVDPHQLIVGTGVSNIIDMLAAALCDAGDAVIVSAPGYTGFQLLLAARAAVEIAVAQLECDDALGGALTLTPRALQKCLDEAVARGVRVRAVLVCSPDNPTGGVLSDAAIKSVVSWARANNLHSIFDEIYAHSVHDAGTTFRSAAAALNGALGDDVHIVWGVSKDFCLAGVRVGVLYSHNVRLLDAMRTTFARLAMPSTVDQWAISRLLSDRPWVDDFLNASRHRVRAAFERCTGDLREGGVPFVPAAAGFFILADLRAYLKDNSREAEVELWLRLFDAGVLITPAHAIYSKTFGYFRVCFANDEIAWNVAWTRLSGALGIQA